MTLNETKINKLKKGERMNKKYQSRQKYGNVSYMREAKSSLVENHKLYLREMVEYEDRNKKKKTKKKEKKNIIIQKKQNLMEDLMNDIVIDNLEAVTKKTKAKKVTKKKEKVEEVKKSDTKKIIIKEEVKEKGQGKDSKTKKKLLITANLKPDAKKNELIL